MASRIARATKAGSSACIRPTRVGHSIDSTECHNHSLAAQSPSQLAFLHHDVACADDGKDPVAFPRPRHDLPHDRFIAEIALGPREHVSHVGGGSGAGSSQPEGTCRQSPSCGSRRRTELSRSLMFKGTPCNPGVLLKTPRTRLASASTSATRSSSVRRPNGATPRRTLATLICSKVKRCTRAATISARVGSNVSTGIRSRLASQRTSADSPFRQPSQQSSRKPAGFRPRS